MLFNKSTFPFKIKKSKKIYTLKQKIKGKGSSGIELVKLTAEDGLHYKLIQLTPYGIFKGEKKRIQRVVENISEYQGRSSVPRMIYSDTNRIVVEWIHGDTLTGKNTNKENYLELAKLNAENFINIEQIPADTLIERLTNQVNELTALQVIPGETEGILKSLFSNKNFIASDHFYEALCFADTASKNYVKSNSEDNRLVYIDVFGLDRRSISRVFTKQLTQIPIEYREEYAATFKSALPVEISRLIPFSYTNYLITRIYSSVMKRNRIFNKKRKRKTDLALNDLRSFLEASQNGGSLEQWIIRKK